jgi:hypothetical protein
MMSLGWRIRPNGESPKIENTGTAHFNHQLQRFSPRGKSMQISKVLSNGNSNFSLRGKQKVLLLKLSQQS